MGQMVVSTNKNKAGKQIALLNKVARARFSDTIFEQRLENEDLNHVDNW